ESYLAAADGENFWRLPLDAELRSQLESQVADLKHTGSRFGGTITAALFLKEFVGDAKWIHLDIAGPAFLDRPHGRHPKGGTGFATLVAASTAEAHLGHAVERAERYLTLELREREVRLVVTLTLGEVEGEALLRAVDEDGDGRVSDEEATEHLGRWAAALEE